jgi:deazaflavin-dependent oxidoreductase (nitroreductase family)
VPDAGKEQRGQTMANDSSAARRMTRELGTSGSERFSVDLAAIPSGTVALMVGRGGVAVFPDTVRRWLYRQRHASRVARFLNDAQARLAAAGVGPRWLVTVEVTGRRSGRTISFPAVVADYDNGRYLVSMLGEDTSWVRNVRASGGRAVLVHGDREPVMLQEVDVNQRAPILRCYLQRAPGARAHIPVDRRAPVEEFERIAARYPVFRIAPG